MENSRKKNLVIAIDGPAASGKSTTAKILAHNLHIVYVDTGAMYRACALKALDGNIALTDMVNLEKMLKSMDIHIQYEEDGNRLFLDGKDVTERIREADITTLSSTISQIGIVRERMVELQRKMGEECSIVMDGRDIGTVVFPSADYKFFLVADAHTRAVRRWKEAKEKGEYLDLAKVEQELLWRDKNDSERAIAPLRKAEDAIMIDTSEMTIQQQVDEIMCVIEKHSVS
ncbi:MAG TPA: (d)CMP kinase [Candidatus Cloacimonadota bacterium]|nr:(d)CMP kinase [Candidatus Cloacimonadota bacterium]HPT72286.1 (d)CMP kinase [Candidatus Cloacimonadota bacterium]